MKDIPESEAVALLSNPLICEDVPEWTFHRLKPGLATLECGLVQQDRSRAGLRISLQFSRSPNTGVVAYKFTVFKMNLGVTQRVYQLQVNAVARNPKNWHDMVHEHMGDARVPGSSDWLAWQFKAALDYFCQRANITFMPPIDDPEVFELK